MLYKVRHQGSVEKGAFQWRAFAALWARGPFPVLVALEAGYKIVSTGLQRRCVMREWGT